jgi:quercetin dioxygenase-like cupin family protein
MAITVVDVEGREWQTAPHSWSGKVREGEPDVRFKPFSTGSDRVPTGQLVEYEAGHLESPHSHAEDEILYLLSGELTIGDTALSPGMLVHIDGGTEYGPLRTQRGCQFLRLGFASTGLRVR